MDLLWLRIIQRIISKHTMVYYNSYAIKINPLDATFSYLSFSAFLNKAGLDLVVFGPEVLEFHYCNFL